MVRHTFITQVCCLVIGVAMCGASPEDGLWISGQDYDFDDFNPLGFNQPVDDLWPREYLGKADNEIDEGAETESGYPVSGHELFERPKGVIKDDNTGKASAAAAAAAAATATAMLPAYCDPPNPCPMGYTSQDGCIEDFDNTSEFSRIYQAHQKCICDNEHMFNCPEEGSRDQLQHADSLFEGMPSLKSPDMGAANPFFGGHKLPVAAKKGLGF